MPCVRAIPKLHAPSRMQVRLLAFAHTREQLGFNELTVECVPGESPRAIVSRVAPSLEIAGIRVAVDSEYHDWDSPIGAAAEIALIPPVSGG
jgi:molybdopterin converting factor small subunit